MKFYRTVTMLLAIVALWLAFASQLTAADPYVGTWVQKSGPNVKPGVGEFTMIIEAIGAGGYRLTYRIAGVEGATTVESRMDGSDAPVIINGKPTGETMAIKRLDERHTSGVVKLNGKQFLVSHGTLSADGNTLTVEDEITDKTGGMEPGKQTEIWVRK